MADRYTTPAAGADARRRSVRSLLLIVIACGLFAAPSRLTAANLTAVPGDNLQTKINSLNAGDTLTLAAGNYNTNFLNVSKSGAAGAWYTIQAATGATVVLTNPGGQNMFNLDNCHYVKITGLEIKNSGTTAGDGIKFTGANSDILIENCYIHNIGGVGVNVSSISGNFQRLTVRHCTITATGQSSGATGEGMYLGKNDGTSAVLNSVFENNWVHHTGGSQGDGIELNLNGHGNIFRDNIIHHTNYPCLFIENSNSGANNIVERNALWNSANETLQVNGYCIVRNNIIQNGGSYALHLSGTGIEVYNNVIYDTGAAAYFGGNLTLKFANNIVDGTTGNTPNGTVTNNYWKSTAYGSNNLTGAPGYNAASMNFYPTHAAYVNAGWNGDGDVPINDFNTTARSGLPDVGCYEITGASNPGWTVGASLKQILPYVANQPPVIDSAAASSPNPVVNAGSSTVSVSAHDPDSGPASLTYTWVKISGPGSVSFAPNGTGGSSVSTATFSATGSYTLQVTVSDSNATATSTLSGLGVTLPVTGTAPSISTQPANKTVTVGSTATFSVAAGGSATLTYQWQKNGGNIGGATSSSYTTPATSLSDNGNTYRVIVTNGYGSATSNTATLTVNGIAPTISTQPANKTVTVGSTATFSVTAGGSATLTYQWQKNGGNIGGATSSSYTTPATSLSDNGNTYRVIVTNSWGTVTSTSATLTVNAGANPVTATVASLNFYAAPGSITPVSTSFTLTNTSGSTVTVSFSSGQSWLSTSPTPTVTLAAGGSATITVYANPSGLSGSVSGTLSLTTSPGGQVRTLPVTLDLTATAGSGGKKSGCALNSTAGPATLAGNLSAWLTLLLNGAGLVLFGRRRRAPSGR